MDILTGLSAATQAIGIAKELRDIDRSVDESSFKLKLAELTDALADTKIALADAKALVAELEVQISEIRDGTTCPKCRTGRLQITEVIPTMHDGVEKHICECDNEKCDYTTSRKFNSSLGKYV
ncbi:hypothetical protein [Celeribacter halophilus]|uniref:Uncharacterized protein n=1 Tax=Celeribacter halophilus TaxID=576117 RepID=A0A1I3SL17_9RHOB|nr:hypothetical protein [Celeribacter halophilus]PZX11657.1 hypothetical protein LX82_01948 [Celeribacter halophilus]SFJ58321.1 hypothetical protein SAMN04488138_106226 [Celeribacter halophilus]